MDPFSTDFVDHFLLDKNISRYLRDYEAFGKRFHEQVVTGTIRLEGDGYVLTEKGEALVKLYDFIADCFGVDKKLIHPRQ